MRKKFNSAQKHFEKKRLELVDQIKSHKIFEEKLAGEHNRLLERVGLLEKENSDLKAQVDKLLSYTQFSQEDIKEIVEMEKKLSEKVSYMNSMFGIIGLGRVYNRGIIE